MESEMDARIRILLRIIEEHGGTLQMSSREIGSLLGVGEARVLRLFNTEVGKTLRRHLLEVKMARAAMLVKSGVLPIKEIAFSCGYTLVCNFCRDFKNIYGISPMQMRTMQLGIQLSDNLNIAPAAQAVH
jgi:AraC-like DNA-binding protein